MLIVRPDVLAKAKGFRFKGNPDYDLINSRYHKQHKDEITAKLCRDDDKHEIPQSSWRDIRDKVLKALDKTFKRRPNGERLPKIIKAKSGDKIIVSFGGLRHALKAQVPTPHKSLVALHIQELIQSSEPGKPEPDRYGRHDPATTTQYHTSANIDGELYNIRIVVNNHSDGNRYYDHFVLERQNPPGISESDRKGDSPAQPASGLSLSIAELSGVFNRTLVKAKHSGRRILIVRKL